MINIETIKFINLLDELAALSENGINPFEDATEETYKTQIFYDSRQREGEKGFRVVLDACVFDDPKCYHHDIISYYDSNSTEYQIRVMIDEDDELDIHDIWVVVKLLYSDIEIVVENGRWHFT